MNRISFKIIFLALFISFEMMYVIPTIGIQKKVYSFQGEKDLTEKFLIAKKAPPRIPETKKQRMDPISKAYLQLGLALSAAMKYEEAIVNLKKVLSKYPESGEANLEIGICYYYTGFKQKAFESFEIASNDTELSSDLKAKAYHNLGIILQQKKQFRQAKVYFKKAFDLTQEPSYYNAVAYLYAQQGIKLNEALELINKAIIKLEDAWDESQMFFYLDTRGWIYYKMGKYNIAERDFLASIEIASKYSKKYALRRYSKTTLAEVYYHLGVVYNAQGKKDLAKQNFIKALNWDNSCVDANKALRNVQ